MLMLWVQIPPDPFLTALENGIELSSFSVIVGQIQQQC
jgi:hypothetical protein